MTRGLAILVGLALVAVGLTATFVRLHVDGVSALAIAGLAVIAIANRWELTRT